MTIALRDLGFRPTQVNSCTLWLRADQGITFGTAPLVAAWADLSGNGNNCAQATGGSQPTWNPVGMLGAPAGQAYLSFSAKHLDGTSNLGFGATNLTIFAFHQWTTVPGVTQCSFYVGDSNTSGISLINNTGPVTRQVQLNGSNGCTDGGLTTNWELWTVENTAGTTTLRVNGVQQAITNSTAAIVQPAAAYHVGTASGIGSLTGNVAEIVCYNRALVASEVVAVEQYLINRYGLST